MAAAAMDLMRAAASAATRACAAAGD